MNIRTVKQLKKFLETVDDKSTFHITYSEDVPSGKVEVDYDDELQEVQIIGSADDV